VQPRQRLRVRFAAKWNVKRSSAGALILGSVRRCPSRTRPARALAEVRLVPKPIPHGGANHVDWLTDGLEASVTSHRQSVIRPRSSGDRASVS
jgi:hypothetical protein